MNSTIRITPFLTLPRDIIRRHADSCHSYFNSDRYTISTDALVAHADFVWNKCIKKVGWHHSLSGLRQWKLILSKFHKNNLHQSWYNDWRQRRKCSEVWILLDDFYNHSIRIYLPLDQCQIRGRMAPPASPGPPSVGQTTLITAWHETSWSSLSYEEAYTLDSHYIQQGNLAHIAPHEPMTSIVLDLPPP